jgi:uncharacterized membrane protein
LNDQILPANGFRLLYSSISYFLTASVIRNKSFSMSNSFVLFLAFAIGVVSGMRSLTAPAVAAWAAHRNWLNLAGSRLAFMGSTAAVAIFTVLALLELITDKLPSTPSRTKPLGLIARFVLGALSGACVAVSAGLSITSGAILGAAGGIAGAFAGYRWRTGLVNALKVPDFVIALLEDAIAIGAGLLIVTRH